MNKLLLIVGIVLLHSVRTVFAQELNCSVQVNAPQIGGVDKNTFLSMENTIVEFMNNQKWTNDAFTSNEKIECNLIVTLESRVGINGYKGKIQVQTRRPVFNTSYNSQLLNHLDNDFQFIFNEFEALNFSENTYISELSSVLSFYAYLIIATDYDSFSLNGGEKYYEKALEVANNAQNGSSYVDGWKAKDNRNNRYWYVQNVRNPAYVKLRTAMYKYHRLGFDRLAKDKDAAIGVVLDALKDLRVVNKAQPGNFNLQVFFNAKVDELVNLFKSVQGTKKMEAYNLLTLMDPAHTLQYEKIKARQ